MRNRSKHFARLVRSRRNAPAFAAAFALAVAGCFASASAWAVDATVVAAPRYPASRIVDVVDDYHGVAVADPYRWLEDADAPETAAWVKAQNEVTFAHLAAIPQRDAIRARMTALWNYERYETPTRKGDWYFYKKNDGLQNQAVVYKQHAATGEQSVFIDPNTFSADGAAALTALEFSADVSLAVYGKAVAGSDWQEFFVRDVATGRDLPDRLRHIKFSGAAWTHDKKGFFYSRYPEPKGNELTAENRGHTVYYHYLGNDQSADLKVYARPDQPSWGMAATATDDGRYVVIDISEGSETKNRIHVVDLIDADEPKLNGPVNRLLDAADASYNFVGNDGTTFYFHTDRDAPRGRLVAIDIAAPAPANWKTLIAQSDDTLQGVSLVGERFVARYLHDAYSRVSIFSVAGVHERDIALPALGATSGFTGKRGHMETFYSFTSYLYPTTVFRYDFATGTSEVFRKPAIDFDASAYETRQVFYSSKDGTRVPMFITMKKGAPLDGSNPTMLFGYGGFNVAMTPAFNVEHLVWLEMGGVYAVANLRGGSEYGEAWHDGGRLHDKQNVFDDCIAAAEYLIDSGYTSKEKLVLHGRSNGGLLVGAVVNQRPDLFAAALPTVGVMDMLRFTKFTIGWAWTSDYGSPETPDGFKTLYAYSPYHNLKKGAAYPATLVTTGDHDDRVVPGHSFKYAAALQAAQGADRPVLIRIDTSAGHGSGKPTTKFIEERADQWAFAADVVGMAAPRTMAPGADGGAARAGAAAPPR
ncbi:MAG: prolyl oligopeptidase family serine peptidase [bacterium]